MLLSKVRLAKSVPLAGSQYEYFDTRRAEFRNWTFEYIEAKDLIHVKTNTTDPNVSTDQEAYIPLGNVAYFIPVKLNGSENTEATRRISEAKKAASRTT